MTEAYPLAWPDGRPRTPPGRRRPGRFRQDDRPITIAGAVTRLREELDRIGARYPVISTDVPVRRDGLPYSSAKRPDDPGVAVYFDLDGRPHCLPCDTFAEVAQNLAAVAAHIEATRAIERYGVADVVAMFRDFEALPPPGDAGPVRTWHEVLGVPPDADRATIKAAWRRLAREHHPDAGGDRARWDEIQAAYEQATGRAA